MAEDDGRPLAEVCAGVARVMAERLGRGPHKCRASWAGRDAIVVLLDDVATPAEQTLRSHGHSADVLTGRRLLLHTLEGDLGSIVTRATGREIAAVLSATRLDPDMSAEVFVLQPAQPHARR